MKEIKEAKENRENRDSKEEKVKVRVYVPSGDTPYSQYHMLKVTKVISLCWRNN